MKEESLSQKARRLRREGELQTLIRAVTRFINQNTLPADQAVAEQLLLLRKHLLPMITLLAKNPIKTRLLLPIIHQILATNEKTLRALEYPQLPIEKENLKDTWVSIQKVCQDPTCRSTLIEIQGHFGFHCVFEAETTKIER